MPGPPGSRTPDVHPGTSVAGQAVLNALAGTEDVGIRYPLPDSNSMPAQERKPARPAIPC